MEVVVLVTFFLLARLRYLAYVDIIKKITALSIDSNGVWYNIDGTLWTSQLIDNNFLELDEVVRDGLELTNEVPDYCSVLNEYYFSFTTDGYNFLGSNI